MTRPIADRLVELRRGFHRHPEPGWREYYTTSRLVEEIEGIGVDELAVGREAYDPDDRMAVLEDDAHDEWVERARERGAREDVLERTAGGVTGCVAVLDRGEGPTVGLRVDIDGLFIEESTDDDHEPAREGFRSETDGTVHACGHDAHMTWGLATLEAVKESDFEGRFVAFFQPAEEISGGGHPMAESRFIEGIDHLFAVHVGLDHPTGRVVAGIERPLAMAHVDASFRGTSAHAGKAPEEGDNAMQALGTAISNAYGIPRHSDGMTRVNVGYAEAGSASNVIAEHARVEAEARGETTALKEYAKSRLERAFRGAAVSHGCELEFDVVSESPRADSDPELVEHVANVARGVDGVTEVVPTADFGASEDATFLMERVQEAGGLATYLIVGTDHPTAHHTPTFDVDERSLRIGVEVLTGAVLGVGDVE
ncbi:aminobenzoyl-glutamate utilization protein A [Halorubrum aquaticum]|uniref:Aminobenzoyl-glutamate utilization protein A n=1 Tax=Halorubrum aquaticum TaxID=387340 RepID=A0A1I2Z410_9EURY|nr:amidohydrolase [Halorubrum aquaticum]SFH32450.1 aminobenzoyl-glutamate utilization protein A [Halorubrum aquaticum]